MTARIGAYLIAVTAACMLAVMADALVKSPPVRRVARLVGGLLILLPMTTSRAVWVIVGLLVIVVGVLMAIDRLKPGKLLGDGGNVIDAQ